ncbi:FAD-dependent monooxygenase [Lichenibacterium dinghuense]|uniref:FAD-dependent monooxygenase n=1 Tax=Lichenibacterium dinghuense TaxID=2895977 RepID=UPI001F01E30A|nr:FAD-dependent monooxygenase [Lichenibacterium sp. 6Y81]
MKKVDVVVVGAGPVGLLLAVELALGGAEVLVLERLDAPSPRIKALGVGPLGAEALGRRGLADAMAAEEARSLATMDLSWRGAGAGPRAPKFVGHFAFLFIREDPSSEPERRMRAIPQQGLESMLGDRARALGIDLRRGCEVTGFAERADGVDVEWTSPGGAGAVRCSYLVGCDGGRSAVRKMGGFAFPGTPPTMTMFQAVADIDDPVGALPRGWHRTPHGVFGRGPFPRRFFMLDFGGPPADRDAPVTREELESVLRRVSGADVRVTAMDQANRWADNTRLADTYRRGQVLLAGDAAHVHSPFGGQGLSLGLGDAANLGWKLAAVLRGDGPGALLDSYTAERRPVAEAVLANTLAQAALLRPDPQSGALRDVLAGLLEMDEVNRRFGEMMRGLSNRYDLGSSHDLVGRLVGDRPLGPDGDTLYGLMQDGAGVLLDASRGGEASALAAGVPRLRCVRVDAGPSVLVRPDGCAAWAGEAGGTEGLAAALGRWFAPARTAGAPPAAPAALDGEAA